MKRGYVRRWLAACTLVGILIGPALAAEPWVVKDRVVGVADGDTVTILDLDNRQHKIRFNGIDAPERGQPSGLRSKENLSKLIYDRNVLALSKTSGRSRSGYGEIRLRCRRESSGVEFPGRRCTRGRYS